MSETKETKAEKKGRERDELHRTIWSIANDLRGAVDGWDFKNYVLGTMFYRYVSERITEYVNGIQRDPDNPDCQPDFDYARLDDETAETARGTLVSELGFFIPPSELFENVTREAPTNPNLNETLQDTFRNIEESARGTSSEGNFEGLFDDFDVNSNKLGNTVAKRNERLTSLLNGIASMRLGSVQDQGIDAFGDAYEYLMAMYASNAGKSGGEFFTPSAVSELLTRLGTLGKETIRKVYDPACGSGSLLLESVKILGDDGVESGFYGQEINVTTYNLCRINMFLHGIGFDRFHIACDDTLTTPRWEQDGPFDLIVSNPPYSIHWSGDDNPLLINDPRFAPAGVLAPKSKADYAFIMHAVSYLSTNGTACIVCFPGIMYRGGKEGKIRKYLVENNFVDSIIQLPENIFYGTSIATCIMVLKKSKKDDKVLFIDASNEYDKATNNNVLTEQNITDIVGWYKARKDVKHRTTLASLDTIREHGHNLSVSTYVEKEDTRPKVDIRELNARIAKIVKREQELRDQIDAIIADIDEKDETDGKEPADDADKANAENDD